MYKNTGLIKNKVLLIVPDSLRNDIVSKESLPSLYNHNHIRFNNHLSIHGYTPTSMITILTGNYDFDINTEPGLSEDLPAEHFVHFPPDTVSIMDYFCNTIILNNGNPHLILKSWTKRFKYNIDEYADLPIYKVPVNDIWRKLKPYSFMLVFILDSHYGKRELIDRSLSLESYKYSLKSIDKAIYPIISDIKDNELIIFTSDHADTPMPDGRYQHTVRDRDNYTIDELHVPMFVYFSELDKNKSADYFTTHVDIMPTILEMCGQYRRMPGRNMLVVNKNRTIL